MNKENNKIPKYECQRQHLLLLETLSKYLHSIKVKSHLISSRQSACIREIHSANETESCA